MHNSLALAPHTCILSVPVLTVGLLCTCMSLNWLFSPQWNHRLTDISQEGLQVFWEHCHSIPKDKIFALLELVLNNCLFSFQHKFYRQLQEAAMGYPISSVIANIYMEYFKKLALGPQCPITTPCWKRSVDHVICITKKDQVDIHVRPY